MKIELIEVLAKYKRLSIFILNNNWENGEAKIAKNAETIDDIPPTSPNTSNSP